MSNFETWSHENLAKFAADANAKMNEQHDRIQQLQCELKDAINAYRAVLKTSEGRPLDVPSPSQTSASLEVMLGTLVVDPKTAEAARLALARLWPSVFEAR